MARSSQRVIAGNGKPKASKAPPPITSLSVSSGCGPKATERSVSVRKIENGFIVRETTYGPKGYAEKERFSATAPKIDLAAVKGKK